MEIKNLAIGQEFTETTEYDSPKYIIGNGEIFDTILECREEAPSPETCVFLTGNTHDLKQSSVTSDEIKALVAIGKLNSEMHPDLATWIDNLIENPDSMDRPSLTSMDAIWNGQTLAGQGRTYADRVDRAALVLCTDIVTFRRSGRNAGFVNLRNSILSFEEGILAAQMIEDEKASVRKCKYCGQEVS
jgi:hypothetical protein